MARAGTVWHPSAMSRPRRILFVCTGNVCRSAMAEHLLRHLAARRGLEVETASVGLAAEDHYRMPEAARRQLEAAGVPPFRHRARRATRALLDRADLILAMADDHRSCIAEAYPELAPRTRLLREAAGFGEEDVEDPMSRPDEEFARCFALIREALEALLRSEFEPPRAG